MFPPYKKTLRGVNEVPINNPNNYDVYVGIRSPKGGMDFKVTANAVKSVSIPNGNYEIYFIYSDRSDELYKGDNFTLKNNGVEIKIVSIVGGNYGISKVK